jgi:hypothetical protein
MAVRQSTAVLFLFHCSVEPNFAVRNHSVNVSGRCTGESGDLVLDRGESMIARANAAGLPLRI